MIGWIYRRSVRRLANELEHINEVRKLSPSRIVDSLDAKEECLGRLLKVANAFGRPYAEVLDDAMRMNAAAEAAKRKREDEGYDWREDEKSHQAEPL